MSIGRVAEETGLSVHALRFFEREDLLLRAVPRTSGGRRVHERADVDWLLLRNRPRASGMPLARIRAFADLVRSGPGNEEARIADPRADLRIIHDKVVAYERHVREGTAAGAWAPRVPDGDG